MCVYIKKYIGMWACVCMCMYVCVFVHVWNSMNTEYYNLKKKQRPLRFSVMILFSFSFQIIVRWIHLIKNSEIMPWTMEQKIFYAKSYYETKSLKIIQARYRRMFKFTTFLKRRKIFILVKNFEAPGTCKCLGVRLQSKHPKMSPMFQSQSDRSVQIFVM